MISHADVSKKGEGDYGDVSPVPLESHYPPVVEGQVPTLDH